MDIPSLEKRIDDTNSEIRSLCIQVTERSSDYTLRLKEKIKDSGLDSFIAPWRVSEKFSGLTPQISYERIRGFFTPTCYERGILTGSMLPKDALKKIYCIMESYTRNWEQYEMQIERLRIMQRDAYADLMGHISLRQIFVRDSRKAFLYCSVPEDGKFYVGILDMAKGDVETYLANIRVREGRLGRWWNRMQMKHRANDECANAYLVESPSSRITADIAIPYAADMIMKKRNAIENKSVNDMAGRYSQLLGDKLFVDTDGRDFVAGKDHLN